MDDFSGEFVEVAIDSFPFVQNNKKRTRIRLGIASKLRTRDGIEAGFVINDDAKLTIHKMPFEDDKYVVFSARLASPISRNKVYNAFRQCALRAQDFAVPWSSDLELRLMVMRTMQRLKGAGYRVRL